MKKFVMTALLPGNSAEAFKRDVLAICPNAKCYNALTYGIRCQQQAVAVELSGDFAQQVNVYDLLASAYRVEFPQTQPLKRDFADRVCTFSVTSRLHDSGDGLLAMWERCQKACASLSDEARQQLNFAIYVDEASNKAYFQACYLSVNDFQAWQQAISDFCLAFMADYSGQMKVRFDKCRLHIRAKKHALRGRMLHAGN